MTARDDLLAALLEDLPGRGGVEAAIAAAEDLIDAFEREVRRADAAKILAEIPKRSAAAHDALWLAARKVDPGSTYRLWLWARWVAAAWLSLPP